MIVLGGGRHYAQRARITALALKHRHPGICLYRAFVEAGGLISYGPDLQELARRAARYVDKTLKGAKPADLPIEQPTKFELVINLKTAKALSLTIPPSLLARADEVIQRSRDARSLPALPAASSSSRRSPLVSSSGHLLLSLSPQRRSLALG